MKRYLLFIIADYYPLGGFDDFAQDFDTIEECILHIKESYKEHRYHTNTAHIFDMELKQVVRYYNINYYNGEILESEKHIDRWNRN